MDMEALQEKTDKIRARNGIQTFGCSDEDLDVFTPDELKYLCNRGLIDTDRIIRRNLMRDFNK